MAKLRVTWIRGYQGRRIDQKRTIHALGLRKLGHTVVHNDSDSTRGMITKVQHLVSVEEAKE
jgi:large subunit ribosomal protein L30